MGFHLFAKKVKDEDLCFIRDYTKIVERLLNVVPTAVLQLFSEKFAIKHNLEDKIQEYMENGHYIVVDYYPSDIIKKRERAKELFSIPKQLPLSFQEATEARFFILGILEKMNFSDADKSWLIKECCFDDSEEVDDDNPIYQSYFRSFK